MKKMIALTLLILISVCFTVAQQTANGIVYHDENKNGKKDRKEKPLEGVAVSNGVDVVRTDANGKYTLTVDNDAIIFVIKPSEFNYPVNEQNLPQFYYIHKPMGSPELDYPGVEPTGELPKSIDFGLWSGTMDDEFSMVVFSDPQPYSRQEVEYYNRSVVEDLKGSTEFDLGITLGDLVGDSLNFYDQLNNATARIGIPWFHVYGNHDMNFDATEDKFADETFERVFGPATFAFNHGKVHFIVLDNVIFPNTINDRFYVGGFREDQFTFIENTLKHVPNDHLVIIAVHIPFFNESSSSETFLSSHLERLFGLLENHPHSLSLSGHTHYQRHYYFNSEHGWLHEKPHHHYNVATASGDWWSGSPNQRGIPDGVMRDGTPRGYNIIHFNGNEYEYEFRAADKNKDYQMRIYAPTVVPQNMWYGGDLFVNFFMGSDSCTVEYKINEDGEYRTMRKVEEFDPHITGLRYQWDHAVKLPVGSRPSAPRESTHLWKSRLPTDLPLGINTIHVKVTDQSGRTFEGEHIFKVEETKSMR